MLVDTHCHIHDSEFYHDNKEQAYQASVKAGVAMVCVGTSVASSQQALEFCSTHALAWPVVGVHPHDTKDNDVAKIADLLNNSLKGSKNGPSTPVIAIGEIGLDYYYNHSPKATQVAALEAQIQLALNHNLPISFHVRDAFSDFWPIIDNFTGVRGVLHSFTDIRANMEQGLARGLFIGVNGISTFTKDAQQASLLTSVPLGKLLLETDAPFLTPIPFRGKMNTPAYVGSVAEYQARARNMPLETVVAATTANATELFGVKFNEWHQQPATTESPG